MFRAARSNSTIGSGFAQLELIYHATVRAIRKSQGNAVLGLLINILQTMLFVLAFYVMFSVLKLRGSVIRGDYMLYLMSGIFLYMTHTKAMGAVSGAESSTSPMMQHAPMTTAVSITASALSSLYMQILSLTVVLGIYHMAISHLEIYHWVGGLAMLLLAWFTGCGVGLMCHAARPWAPEIVGLIQTIYTRLNMIASGKMFVVNMMPHKMLVLFSWNPLFHLIDQARGFLFINYNPRYTSWDYALYVGLALVMIGLMGEFFTRQYASLSWGARR